MPNMSAPPCRCWVGNAASSVCAVGQRTHPAEVQSEPHLPSDVVLGQLVTERIGLENGIVLSFSSLSLSKWLPVQALPEEKLSHRVPRVQLLLAGSQGLPIYTILILTIG